MYNSRIFRAVVAVSLLAFLLVIAMHTSQPSRASTTGAPTVTVVNTGANPVPVTGTVTGTVTGSVSVTNTPSVNVANTPSVTLSGTPTVNVGTMPAVTLSGTSDVNIVSGNVNAQPPLASRLFNFVDGLDAGGSKEYPFSSPIKVSSVIVDSTDDLNIFLRTVIQPEGNQLSLIDLGRIPGGSGRVINLQIPIQATGFIVDNPAVLAHAIFAVEAIGN